MMHQATRATETVAPRICQVADALKQSKKRWFSELKKVAWKVCFTSYDVTFDERGVLAFYEKAEELLTLVLVLCLLKFWCFCNGLKKIFHWILNTPKELTREMYECHARVLLGFQFVLIFVLGLELDERKITLDTSEQPQMFYKRKNEPRVNSTWSEHFENFNPAGSSLSSATNKTRVQIQLQQPNESFSTLIHSDENLKKAAEAGIRETCTHSSQEMLEPEAFFPVAKDGT